MPKPPLFPEQQMLAKDMKDTMRAGLKRWRPDLDYPESASDMDACVRALMVMYEIKRRPLPVDLDVPCGYCHGHRHISVPKNGICVRNTCEACEGTGKEKFVGQ